jgi:hypothetical protein
MQCAVCNVSLPPGSALETHFTGRKHRQLAAATDLRARQEGKAVYLTKLGDLRLTDLHNHLTTFGPVVNFGVGEDQGHPGRLHHVIAEFDTEEAARSVLQQGRRGGLRVEVGGSGPPPRLQSIQAYERQFRDRRRSPSPEPCHGLDGALVRRELAMVPAPGDQLERLEELCRQGREEGVRRAAICRLLQQLLTGAGHALCRVRPFGSSASR